jgi:hypothetical protein
MTIEGVDYADARPSPAKLYALGKRFVVRYGGPGRTSKQLSEAELKGLIGAGLSVVANAEGAADGYRGRTVGRAWAKQAEEHFRSLGMPGDRPIYFSVDWAAGADDWADIDAALRGSAEIIGAARVGVYGGYNTIRHCATAGTARWLWQTYAWSDGRWWAGAHLQQYRNGVTVAGGDCDLNRAMVADYGQWGQKRELVMAIEDADAEKIASAVWNRMFTRPNGPDAHGNKRRRVPGLQRHAGRDGGQPGDRHPRSADQGRGRGRVCHRAGRGGRPLPGGHRAGRSGRGRTGDRAAGGGGDGRFVVFRQPTG